MAVIAVGSAVSKLVFTNTPAEQRLQLTRDRQSLSSMPGDSLAMPLTREEDGVSGNHS
jgi:hypothetical protein